MIEGLEDVVAARTTLSDVDGQAGRLVIRGRDLDELAGHADYEEIVALLLTGFLDLPLRPRLRAMLGQARVAVWSRTGHLLPELARLPVYDGVRAGTSLLADGTSPADALALIAAPAVLTPALVRISRGQDPLMPEPDRSHAEDALRMLGSEVRADALDAYLVTVCDHGLNASTFAARVVASTQAGLCSAVLAGLGALKGPLHGGAPGPVLDMLDAIDAADDAEGWIRNELDAGRRLMGFGHRIYRVRDPRADALKTAVERLDPKLGRLRRAQEVEAVALRVLAEHRPGRVLQTNVEFYTAVLLEALGFPREAFTCVFAMGRVSGWIGHALEQRASGRLIRPKSEYVGPAVRTPSRMVA